MVLTTTTCGPERLLSILRHVDEESYDSESQNIVVRMVYETPPFGVFKQVMNERGQLSICTSDKKFIQDISASIKILIADGNASKV